MDVDVILQLNVLLFLAQILNIIVHKYILTVGFYFAIEYKF